MKNLVFLTLAQYLAFVGAIPIKDSSCPAGYFSGASPGVCYKYEASKKNFFNAQKNCQSQGGALASVEDAFTNTLIQKQASEDEFFQNPIWLGGTKYDEPTWTWVDGSLFTYTNWDFFQPNIFIGNDCVYMSVKNGKWTNENCLIDHAYVCELKVAVPTTTTTKKVTTPKVATTKKEVPSTRKRVQETTQDQKAISEANKVSTRGQEASTKKVVTTVKASTGHHSIARGSTVGSAQKSTPVVHVATKIQSLPTKKA